jgi:hypothetical protein
VVVIAKGQATINPNRSFGVKGISLLEKRLTEPTLLEMDEKGSPYCENSARRIKKVLSHFAQVPEKSAYRRCTGLVLHRPTREAWLSHKSYDFASLESCTIYLVLSDT